MTNGDDIDRALRLMRNAFMIYSGFVLGVGIGIGMLLS